MRRSGHLPIDSAFNVVSAVIQFQYLHEFGVRMEREHLTAQIDEVAPPVPHQVVQTIHFGQQDADVSPIDALETGRHEDVGKASRHGLQGAQGGGVGLAVDV